MTYSRDESYVSKVRDILSKSDFNYRILENFRENDEVAKLAGCGVATVYRIKRELNSEPSSI